MLTDLFYSGPPRNILHEAYAKQSRIDEQAPLQTASTIDIDAPIGQVWKLLVNLPEWPTIDPSFQDVRLESSVTVDAHFRFKLKGFPMRAKFAVVEPERELTWTGTSLWFTAVDLHTLASNPDGSTRLHIAESLAGIFAPLFTSRAQLKRQHDAWLAGIKAVAEGRHDHRNTESK